MAWIDSISASVVCILWILCQNVVVASTCRDEDCEHGCCNADGKETCCTLSTSVLVVACVVSGLVLIALVASVIICCYKNYKDKQASRVRRIQQEEAMNAPRVPGVEPRKPPEYISAPPAYSVEMPESHYRPQTVTGQVQSYNQRFRGTTPAQNRTNVAATRTSGRYPNTNAQIPGSVPQEAPPAYSEFIRGQTPANRRQQSTTANNNTNPQSNNVVLQQSNNNNEIGPVTVATTTMRLRPRDALQTQTIVEANTPTSSISDLSDTISRAETSRADTTRSDTTRADASRALESRVESRAELQSRSETVARVLGASRARAQSRTRTPRARLPGINSDANPYIHVIANSDNVSEANRSESSANTDSTLPGTLPGTNTRESEDNTMLQDLTVV